MKVFYRCVASSSYSMFTIGKEYECITDSFVVANNGYSVSTCKSGIVFYFGCQLERIEREVFTAHGFEWFRHTPGDPMPCDGANRVSVLCGSTTHLIVNVIADNLDWRSGPGTIPIIAWRYAETKPSMYDLRVESCVATPNPPHIFDGQSPQEVCAATNEIFAPAPGWAKPLFSEHTSTDMIKRVCAEYSEDESERNDLIAAVEDSTLTPSQRRHWEEMEAKQAAREQLKHDAETKALQDRADQLADAGRAMDRVNQDHNHRMGWRS